jgi:hypothetical protein
MWASHGLDRFCVLKLGPELQVSVEQNWLDINLLFLTCDSPIHELQSCPREIKQDLLFNRTVQWVVPEKIHTLPTEEISAVRRWRGEKIVSDNRKCIRTSEGGRGVNFLNFLRGGGMDVFWNDPIQC